MPNKDIVLFQPAHGVWDSLFTRIPESILAIAAAPYHAGYNVTIIDQRITKNWKTKLAEAVKKKPICVGITALTGPSLGNGLDAVEVVKQADPNARLVFGGVHCTLLPEQVLGTEGIDYVLAGDADYSFFDLVQALEKDKPLDNITGLYYTNNEGKTISTEAPPLITDMDALPEYPYDLIDLNKYAAADISDGKSVSFQTSRGCPFRCTFCGNERLQEAKFRLSSAERVAKKVKWFRDKYGYRTFVFQDDLTVASVAQFRELANALKPLNIYWQSIGIRCDLISRFSEEDVQLLWDSGCRALDIGIESGSDRIIKYIQKAETKEKMRTSNKLLALHPFKVKYTFIVGYPSETESERNETLDFYKELSDTNPNVYPMIFVYCPIVGTALYDELVSNGWKPPQTTREWADMDSQTWYYKYDSWIPEELKRQFETIMISAIFCSSNARLKFTKPFAKFCFYVYHPIASLRFKYKFFGFPVERLVVNAIEAIKKIKGNIVASR